MSKTILIVDDEEDVRAIAKLGLEMVTDWNIIMANSGTEALSKAAQEQPDVILLDMMMPDLDGRETLKKLKENPQIAKIPVILVTAKLQKSETDNFNNLPIVAIFPKPFRPLTLAQQIKEVLGWI